MRKLVAAGFTSEVFAVTRTRVLKLYRPWVPECVRTREAAVAAAAAAHGVRTPAVEDLVEVDGRLGIVFERVHGPTLWQHSLSVPFEVANWGERFAEVLLSLHAVDVAREIPNQADDLMERIGSAEGIPDVLRRAARRQLERSPNLRRLCHGDFWPGNVILRDNHLYVIDWAMGCAGSPTLDFAQAVSRFQSAQACQLSEDDAHISVQFQAAFQEAYVRQVGDEAADVDPWLGVVAVSRVGEGVDGIHEWLRTVANASLTPTDSDD